MPTDAKRRSVLSEIKQSLVDRQSKFRVRRDLIRAGYDETEVTELIGQAVLEMKEGRRYTAEEMKARLSETEQAQNSYASDDARIASAKPQAFGPSAFEKLHMFRSTTGLSYAASIVIGITAVWSMVSTFITDAVLVYPLLAVMFLISEFAFTYWTYRSAQNIESFNPRSYNVEGKSIVWQTVRNGRKQMEAIWRTSDPAIDVSVSVEWQELDVRPMRHHASAVVTLWIAGIIFFTFAAIPSAYFWRTFFLPTTLFSQIYWVHALSRRQLAKYNSLLEKQIS